MKYVKRNRYYKQILAALFVATLLPITFLGVYVRSFVSQQQETVYRSYVSQIENQMENFETVFSYVDTSLIRMGVKSSFQNALKKERVAANFQLFHSLDEDMTLLGNTQEYLIDVYLYSADQEWILGSTTFTETAKHPEGETLSRLFEQEQSAFWHNDGTALYMCRKIPLNDPRGSGMLVAKFDAGRMLSQIVGEEEDILILLDQENQIMAASGGLTGSWSDLSAKKRSERSIREMTIVEVEYGGEPFVQLNRISEYNGWTYLLLIPIKQLSGTLNRILQITLFAMAVLFVVDLLIILVLSRRLYRPIDEIDTVISTGIRHAEGWEAGDLENVELMNRVQYVVKKNVELNRRLSRESRAEQQLFLRKVYQGEVMPANRKLFEDRGLLKDFPQDGTWFVMAIKYNAHFETEEDKHLYLFALDNIVSELVNDKNTFPLVMIGSIMYLTCCIKTDSDESAVMKTQMLAIMIITTVKKYMGKPVNVGISQGFSELDLIYPGLEESRRALQNAMGADGEVSFYHGYKTAGESMKGHAEKRRRVTLLHYVDLGEQSACKEELEAYIRGISALDYYVFKLEICKLVSEVLSIYTDYGVTPDYEKVGDIIDFDITKTVNNREKLEHYIWNYLLEPLFAIICNQAKERDMMQQVVEYVLEHLQEDISLEECARHFNYNANYLSRWFKKRMGMTYTDFVTSKKMELCKTLLASTDISINSLAEQFGYSSPQNFIRVFKKYTLMTPGKYRKMEQEKAREFVNEQENADS